QSVLKSKNKCYHKVQGKSPKHVEIFRGRSVISSQPQQQEERSYQSSDEHQEKIQPAAPGLVGVVKISDHTGKGQQQNEPKQWGKGEKTFLRMFTIVQYGSFPFQQRFTIESSVPYLFHGVIGKEHVFLYRGLSVHVRPKSKVNAEHGP